MVFLHRAYVNVTLATDVIVISHDVKRALLESKISGGIAQVFIPYGTAAVTILENDPSLFQEYKNWVESQIPATQDQRPKRRSGTGRNYAHLRAGCVGQSVQIPVYESKLQMSPWQEVVFFDFDDIISRKEIYIVLTGD